MHRLYQMMEAGELLVKPSTHDSVPKSKFDKRTQRESLADGIKGYRRDDRGKVVVGGVTRRGQKVGTLDASIRRRVIVTEMNLYVPAGCHGGLRVKTIEKPFPRVTTLSQHG